MTSSRAYCRHFFLLTKAPINIVWRKSDPSFSFERAPLLNISPYEDGRYEDDRIEYCERYGRSLRAVLKKTKFKAISFSLLFHEQIQG